MNAAELAHALGGRRSGGVWFAKCPAHSERTPSLAIADGTAGVLVRCHAGCPQERVIDALRHLGLWAGRARVQADTRQPAPAPEPAAIADGEAQKREQARAIWEWSAPAAGTLAETYLRSRRIALAPPETIRFNPSLRHADGTTWPAMIALVQRGTDGEPMAVHRTYLARDGAGKAPVEPAKMMLGPTRGGAVRLAPARELVMVGEGIETCFSAMQATGLPAWAALSTSGLRALELPPEIRTVIVLADADEPGEAAARHAGARWAAEGRAIRIARPPPGAKDFNDALA